MQKAVSDVIDIFTGEDMENTPLFYFLVKHSHLYNKSHYFIHDNIAIYYLYSSYDLGINING